AIGELLQGDRLRHDDVADLLGRRTGLHVVALLFLARPAKGGKRAGAAIVRVGQGAGDGELAAMALIVAAAAARTGRFGATRSGRMAAWAPRSSALVVLIRGGRGGLRFDRRLGRAFRFFLG